MIVISSALALSLVESRTANNPVVGWRNLVSFGSVVADHEAAGYPASNLANPATDAGQQWRSDSTAEQFLTFSVVSESPVDYVGIARHNFGSSGAMVSIEYPDPENEEEWLELVEPFLPGDDSPILARFVPTFLESLRIRIQPVDTPPRAAVVYIGEILVMQRRVYVGHTPITMGRSQNVQHNWSEGGDFLGSVLISEKRTTSFPMANLTPAWVRAELAPFLVNCRTSPFFWAWRPGDYPREVGFVVAQNDPRPTNQRSNGMMQVEFQLGGIAP